MIVGTDAQFTRVVLPQPTQECVENRADISTFCGDDEVAKVGVAAGACDTYSRNLKKLLSLGLRKISLESATSEALWSPAYEAISNFQISTFQYGEIFQKWLEVDGGKWNYDNPRDAACRWAVENLDLLNSFVPQTYPRAMRNRSDAKEALQIFGLVFACFSMTLILLCFGIAFLKRNTKAMYFIQLPFLHLLLVGLLLVASGGLVTAMRPSDTTCLLSIWLNNVGSALVTVPMTMRIYTINHLVNSGKMLKRVRIKLKKLFRTTGFVLALVVGFLISWTMVDPPLKTYNVELSSEVTRGGETIVDSSESCNSNGDFWTLISISWQALLLLPAVVIAIVVSRLENMNDTKTLGVELVTRGFYLIMLLDHVTLHSR